MGVKPGDGGVTYRWEMFNRGKKSIGVDLGTPEGHEVLMSLLVGADVFITNFLPPARQKLGIDTDYLLSLYPGLIYARGSGHGPKGPDADKGGFDGLSYWARVGNAVAAIPADYDYPLQLPGPAFGDIQSGAHLAGGVAAALFHRERTGQGCVVDVSLLGSGLWAGQANIVGASVIGVDVLPPPDRRRPQNPLGAMYRTSDNRFLMLGFLESQRYWPKFCEVLGLPSLATDQRFATHESREANVEECVAKLAKVFGKHTLAEWRTILSRQEGPWAEVPVPRDVIHDEQARANGYFCDIAYPSGTVLPLVVAPAQFDQEPAPISAAPTFAENTDEVLLSLGRDWDEILQLKESGVIT